MILQIFIVLVIGWGAIFAIGFQVGEFYKSKSVKCPWNKCSHNDEGVCTNKDIELKTLFVDDHLECMTCGSFEAYMGTHIDIKV